MAIRITNRDRLGVAAVASQRLIRLDDLATVLALLNGSQEPIRIRTARTVVQRWVDLGLVETKRSPVGGLAMVSPTPHGARWVGRPVPRPVPWVEIPHALTTSAVMVRYLASDPRPEWASETDLRRILPEGAHRPDGVATLGEQRIAVEVERNTKSAERWQEIVTDLLTTYSGAHYWTTDPVGRSFQAWAEANLPPEALTRVRVFSLAGVAR